MNIPKKRTLAEKISQIFNQFRMILKKAIAIDIIRVYNGVRY